MLWRVMVLSCACVVVRASGSGAAAADHLLEPRWQREVRALLEASSWLQPSGPGHGRTSRDFEDYKEDGDEDQDQQERDLEDNSNIRLAANKRALSALSRWKPFSSAWGSSRLRPLGRAPLVAALLPPDADLVSAETRNIMGQRPMGQPLRWGKRRR
ncbi:uncharacterized protein LOC111058214 isoform X2 [Nilaparvata lugens]|nr:uncharacterized protein LOC111058214 isoform X2 [Nilaparvata lugens]XP_039289025.1 uncharacterized protein LOC111058214 isoform X2 [Nilaparvata lugens]XP_039289026.1 uncharacterized protein LOC111058214 isoform X2 [Nilaparvata lugens]